MLTRKTYMTWSELDRYNGAVGKALKAGSSIGSALWHCPCCNYETYIGSSARMADVVAHIESKRCNVLDDSDDLADNLRELYDGVEV